MDVDGDEKTKASKDLHGAQQYGEEEELREKGGRKKLLH